MKLRFKAGPFQTYGDYKLERVSVKPAGESGRNLQLHNREMRVRAEKPPYLEAADSEAARPTSEPPKRASFR